MKSIEKTPYMAARDLIKGILNQGFYVQIRCMEEQDLLQTPTADKNKALDAIFSVDDVFVEAVKIDREKSMGREIVARFLCLNEMSGPDWIADYSANEIAEKLVFRANI
jgi:hypothetical protein